MNLIEINPFLRYIAFSDIMPGDNFYTAFDNRIFAIVNGNGTVIVNDRSYEFSSGSVMLWKANVPYKFVTENSIQIVTVNFDFTLKRIHSTIPIAPIAVNKPKTFFFEDTEDVYFDDCTALNSPIVINNSAHIVRKLNNLVDASHESKPWQKEQNSAELKKCIIDIAVVAIETYSVESKLNTVVSYIKENYNTNISNKTLAELVGYHPYHLNRIFLEAKNITLHQYIMNYRLTIAMQLLSSTEYSISDVAQFSGFKNNHSFTENFKKKNNMTPSEYRKHFKTK